MADFIFRISPNIVLGSYTSTRLGQYALDYGSKYMLLMDPILKEKGIADKITQNLKDHGVDFFIYDEIQDSTTEILEPILKLARDARVEGIIAIGGGRILSIAKAVSSIYYEKKGLYDYLDTGIPSNKSLPLICLPSTNRDGFLFTDYAPITDSRTSKIKLLKTQNGLCRLILWDPNLQTSLTDKQIESMAIESLAFAIEGYLSQKSNFFSDMIIEKSVELLGYGLDGVDSLSITTPKEVLLAQGGCMASLGAALSSLGVCNLISNAVCARYRISRSLVTVVLLPHIIEDAISFRADKIAKLSKILRAATAEMTQEEACTALVEYVRQKIAKVNVPARLKELSLTIEQLSLAIEDAGELELINSLPRSMTTDNLFEMVKKAF